MVHVQVRLLFRLLIKRETRVIACIFIMNYEVKGLTITDVDVDGINTRDYPDFCDAYICGATIIEGCDIREATESELDLINEDRDFIYDQVLNYLF